MIQIPAVVLFAGCLLFSAAAATAVWSLTQVLLERPRRGSSSGAGEVHLRRALEATAIAAVVAVVPSGLSNLQLLAGVAGAL